MIDRIMVGVLVIVLVSSVLGTVADSTTGQTSTGSTGTIDSYHPAPDFMFGNGNGTGFAAFSGETFVVSGSYKTISSAQFLMNKTNTWTGGIVAQVWKLQGTPGVDGLPQGTGTPTGAFPQGSLLTSNPITDSSVMPTNATAIPVTFTFPSPSNIAPGNYVLTFTENSTQAVGASPLIGHGLTAIPHTIVEIGMKTGGLAGYNSFRDNGIILSNGRNFWFTVTGNRVPNPNITGTPGFSALLLIFPTIFIIGVAIEFLSFSRINRGGL
jgi:hypothetical protein